MERKPYYVLRLKISYFILHQGIVREVYPNNGNGIQLYLTDEERDRCEIERFRIRNILEPYACVLEKRYMYMPTELILWAIEKVLYEREREEEE